MLVATLVGRWLLALVLIGAGAAKIGRSDVLAAAIRRYGFLPEVTVPAIARLLPPTELVLGGLLAVGALTSAAGIAAGCLFAIFAAAVAVSLARGRSFDCGCGLGADSKISWRHVGRSTLLVGLSVVVAVEPAVLAIGTRRTGSMPAAVNVLPVPLTVLLACLGGRLVGPTKASIHATHQLRQRSKTQPSSTVEA